MDEPNYYGILGVASTATEAEIKKAYKRLAQRHHPDKNNGSKISEEQFKKILEAYEALSNPDKRKQYDQKLKREWQKQQNKRNQNAHEQSRRHQQNNDNDRVHEREKIKYQQTISELQKELNHSTIRLKRQQQMSALLLIVLILGSSSLIFVQVNKSHGRNHQTDLKLDSLRSEVQILNYVTNKEGLITTKQKVRNIHLIYEALQSTESFESFVDKTQNLESARSYYNALKTQSKIRLNFSQFYMTINLSGD